MVDSSDENEDKKNVESNTKTSTVPFPPFWSSMPDIWFLQMEAVFKIKKIIKDENKFYHTVACLPVEIISSVSDIIKNTEDDNSYVNLKNAILKRKTLSETQRLEQLLDGSAIGDRSPSQYYRDMLTLAGESSLANDKLLKALWLKRLPDQVRVIVASRESEDMDKLCDLADKIWDISSSSSSKVSSIQNPCSLTELNDTISSLRSRFDKFESKFSQDSHSSKPRSNSNSNRNRRKSQDRSKSREKNSSSKKQTNTKNPCWYHWQYGNNAKKCNGGSCTYSANSNSGN